MARTNDGELCLEIEDATDEQVSKGLFAARSYLARNGINAIGAMRSLAKMQTYVDQQLLWEQGKGEHPDDLSEDEWTEGEIAEEALMAALEVAGFPQGHPSKLTLADSGLKAPEPVVRDLFEPAE